MNFRCESGVSTTEDKKEIKNLVKEDIELDFSSLQHTYAEFKVTSIDNKKVDKDIVVYFYYDLIYMPIDSRPEDYKGKFVLYNNNFVFFEKKIYKDEYEEGNIISVKDIFKGGINYA